MYKNAYSDLQASFRRESAGFDYYNQIEPRVCHLYKREMMAYTL